ncbi:MAG: hypothetical protein DWQ01_02680 [Planctomycetota bacterium]|nr:MAG: hypothetical protein DWQ01_02680 [Planctomycetota bacterium]
MTPSLLLLAAALLFPQQNEVVRDFKKYFKKVREPAERVEYVYSLEGIDDPDVAEVLLPVLSDKEPLVAAAALDVLRKLPSEKARSPLLKVVEKGKPKGALPVVIRAVGEGPWPEFQPLVAQYLEAKDDEVRLWTVTSLGALKAAEHLPVFGQLLTSDDNKMVRVACADALGHLGKGSEAIAGPPLVQALSDKALEVQTSAMLALQNVRVREAIPVLIDILENGEGRVLEGVYPALVAITDMQYTDDPKTWRRWWSRAHDEFQIPTEEELAKRKAARQAVAQEYRPSKSEATFMGIDTPSQRVVFVIDVSGSMEEKVLDRDTFRERGYRRFGKLDIVKEELARTIENLDRNVIINVYAFASHVHPWRKSMVAANALNRRSALDFIRKLKPIGGSTAAARAAAGLRGSAGVEDGRTNTYAALLAGLGLEVKKGEVISNPGGADEVKSEVDTLFFLSDGRPSIGELVDPDDILEAVTELNRFRRVTVHTIAIGEFQKDFMQELARRNGGVFVDLGR